MCGFIRSFILFNQFVYLFTSFVLFFDVGTSTTTTTKHVCCSGRLFDTRKTILQTRYILICIYSQQNILPTSSIKTHSTYPYYEWYSTGGKWIGYIWYSSDSINKHSIQTYTEFNRHEFQVTYITQLCLCVLIKQAGRCLVKTVWLHSYKRPRWLSYHSESSILEEIRSFSGWILLGWRVNQTHSYPLVYTQRVWGHYPLAGIARVI